MKAISVKEAYLDFWRKGFSFEGRSSRKEYWVPMIINLIIVLLLIALTMFMDYQLGYSPDDTRTPGSHILNFVELVYFIPTLALLVRRLHDLDLPGIFAAVPIVLGFFAMIIILAMSALHISNSTAIIIIVFILILVQIILFLICTLKKGTIGSNDYGEDPLAE